jgi:hypothetical protein
LGLPSSAVPNQSSPQLVTFSAGRLRAPSREGSTVARSDECAHRRSTSRRRHRCAYLRWVTVESHHRWSLSLSLSVSFRSRMFCGLGFGGARPIDSVLFARRARSTVWLRWTTNAILGSFRPRWARSLAAQTFAALIFVRQAEDCVVFSSCAGPVCSLRPI